MVRQENEGWENEMDETLLWKEAAKWLWGGIVAVGVFLGSIGKWFLGRQEARIKALEDTAYTKSAAKERREEVDKHLEYRRQDVISLHAKIDSRSEKLDDKIDAMAKEMNQGFSDIKNLFIKHIK
jgi:hypothetical protein